MYYIAISKTGFSNDMLFWDKKAQAFINKLPDMKKDAYKNFHLRNKPQYNVLRMQLLHGDV